MRKLMVLAVLLSLPGLTRGAYQPVAEQVVDNVYAMVGPLGQRSVNNDGLNANFGFIVTDEGVILIDSGASRLGAEKLAAAIRAVTDKPVRWVINTGRQDHRWLGNDYFSRQGAEVVAMSRTAATQGLNAQQQVDALERFLGERLQGTRPLPAPRTLDGQSVTLALGGETLELAYTDAHFPGDTWIWLPQHGVVFSGDLVYVDRLLGLLPASSVRSGQLAFHALEQLPFKRIVPGHGRLCDRAQAKRQTGDYYDFLVETVGGAAREMEPMDATQDRYADLPQFRHLQHYETLHRANMNRAFLELEAAP